MDRFLASTAMLSNSLIRHRQRFSEHYLVSRPRKPRVLVLFCGGTIIMQENESGSLVVTEKDDAIDLLFTLEPRLADIADIDVEFIANIDSTNMNPDIWNQIASCINDHYQAYDGFVITHGTDTLAYTASALSFVLGDLGKPVVLTGAQIPAGKIESDARCNFVNSVRIATFNKAGVMVVFNEEIILGARSHKISESKLNAFASMNSRVLGEIRVDIRFRHDAKERHNRPLQFRPGFEKNISVFTLFPGFPVSQIEAAISWGVKGIILRGFGSGNISYEYLDAVKYANKKKIPVVVDTQCLEGATLMHLYDVGLQALDNGVIQAYDMSTECVITKLMWALKQAEKYEEVQEIMHTNYSCEINKEARLF